MSGRPRTSTLVISGLFLAVLALYILIRPVPASVSADTGQSSVHPSSSPTWSSSPTRSVPSPSRTPSPSRSPSVSPSATPSGPVAPTGTASPGASQTTAPPGLNPLPATTGSPTP